MNLKLLCVSVAMLSLVACNNNDEPVAHINSATDSGIMIATVDTCDVLSLSDVDIIAENLAGNIKNEDSRTYSYRKVKDILVYPDSNNNALLYIVNFENNNGFTIISATRKTKPVIASSNSGTFDLDKIDDSGVGEWIAFAKEYILEAKKFPIDSIYSHIVEWGELLPKYEQMISSHESRSIDDEREEFIRNQILEWQNEGWQVYRATDWTFVGSYGNSLDQALSKLSGIESYWPGHTMLEDSYMLVKRETRKNYQNQMVKTSWGQLKYYNEMTPNNWPVGCAAVALAQIIRSFELDLGYDYKLMPNRATSSCPELARFLADVGAAIGVIYGQYNTVATMQQVYDAMVRYGLQGDLSYTYPTDIIYNSLRNSMPVITAGGQHAWIIDGLRDIDYTDKVLLMAPMGQPGDLMGLYLPEFYQEERYEDLSVHMNWGYDGDYNGYYDIEFTTPGSYNFTSYRHGIYNIRTTYGGN